MRKSTGRRSGALCEPAVDLETVEIGQHHVEHDQVGREVARDLDGCAAALGGADFEPLVAKHGRDQVGDAVLVVDHEHAGLGKVIRWRGESHTSHRIGRSWELAENVLGMG